MRNRTAYEVRGGYHGLRNKVTVWLAEGNLTVPDCLTLAEENGEPFWLGKSGRHYSLWIYGPSALRVSLYFAVEEEERVLREAAHPAAVHVQRPGTIEVT